MRPARLCGCGSHLAKSEHRCPTCREAHYRKYYHRTPGKSLIKNEALAAYQVRTEAMAELYRAGFTLQQIGTRYDVTRERVRQIIQPFGLDRSNGGQSLRKLETKARKTAAMDAKYLKSHGMTFAEYQHLRDIRATRAYSYQKRDARTRNIAWEFPHLASWWRVWTDSGKWDRRGRGIGKYAMSRPGDIGPYSPNNVKIILATDNSSEAIRRTIATGKLHSKSNVGSGVGFFYDTRSRIKPFKVQALGRHIGQFDNALDARAAYLRAVRA